MKRIFTVILASVLLMSAFIICPDAANTISQVELTNVREILPYCTPDYFVFCKTSGCDIVKYNQGYYKDGVAWYDVTEGKYISSGDPGIEGHKYRIYIYVAVNDGYTFATKNNHTTVTAKVNGSAAYVNDYSSAGFAKSEKEISIFFDFPTCAEKQITQASALVASPSAAKTPDFMIDREYEDYHVDTAYTYDGFINGVKWMQLKKESNNEMTIVKALGENDVFDYNSPYRVHIRIAARNGREFKLKPNGQPDVTAKVNGKTAYAIRCDSQTNAKIYIVLSCEFDQIDKTTISSVSIAGLAEPVENEKANTSCNVSDATYTVSNQSWYDQTASKTLSASDKFDLTHQYSFSGKVNAATGCEFSKSVTVTVTVNGRSAVVTENSTSSIGFKLENIQVSPSETITTVDITDVTVPVKGGTPGHSVTVSPSVKCEIDKSCDDSKFGVYNGVQWLRSSNTVKVGEKFGSGAWTVCVFLKAKPGFEFEHNAYNDILTTATVNGIAAQIAYDWVSVTEMRVTFEFPSIPPETVYDPGVTLTAPSAGAKPSFEAAPDSAAYYVSSTTGTNIKNGVTWLDTTTGTYLKDSDKFTAGHAYRCYVALNAAYGNSFTTGILSCTMNGKACSYSGGQLQSTAVTLFYDFPQLPGGDKSIEKVTLDGTFGENAVLSSKSLTTKTAGIASVTTEWECDVSGACDEGTKVEAGKQYMAYVTLKAAPGYVFSANTKVTLFGTEHEVWISEQNKTAEFNTAPMSVKAHSHTLKRMSGKAATCTEPGSREYYVCTSCGAMFSDSKAKLAISTLDELTIAPLGHSVSDTWQSDSRFHWRTCTRCGEVLDETKMLHEDTNGDGKCDTCAYTLGTTAASSAPVNSSEPVASSETAAVSEPAVSSEPAASSEPASSTASYSPAPSSTEPEQSEGFQWWIAAVAAGAACIAAAATVLIIKKKK